MLISISGFLFIFLFYFFLPHSPLVSCLKQANTETMETHSLGSCGGEDELL